MIENGTAHLRVVVPGDAEGDAIRVTGLSGGEVVATSRQGELFDGATVEVQG